MKYFIIFLILIFIIITTIHDNDNIIIMDFFSYHIEIRPLLLLLLAALTLLIILLFIRMIFLCYAIIKKIERNTKEKILILLSKSCIYLELEDLENAQKYSKQLNYDYLEKNDSWLLFQGILNLKIKQYTIAREYLIKIRDTNLTQSLGHWLINYILVQESNPQKQIMILEDFITIFYKQPWIKILQIEIYRIKKDWHSAIKHLKTSLKSNYFKEYPVIENLIIFYYALAQELYDDNKYYESIKVLNEIPSKNNNLLFIILLKAKLYYKINKIKKALSLLEDSYEKNPHMEIAVLYLYFTNNYSNKRKKLYDISPNYYFSIYIKAEENIVLGKYNEAIKDLNIAFKKFPYLCLYKLMLKLMVLSENNSNTILLWMKKFNNQSLNNPFWQCSKCYSIKTTWWYECNSCGSFNSIIWIKNIYVNNNTID